MVRARVAEDGVYWQWGQVYQLPLTVVASLVRNLRAVFPHVEVWFSSGLDLMVLGSGRPIRYDRAWLARLLAPTTPVGALSRERLGIDSAGEHLLRRPLRHA